MKLDLSQQIIKKYSDIKFHDNSSSGVQLFHVDGQTKVTVAFGNLANMLKNKFSISIL